MHLLCIHVSPVCAYETICEKKYEIVECIINVWGNTEILPRQFTEGTEE